MESVPQPDMNLPHVTSLTHSSKQTIKSNNFNVMPALKNVGS